MGSNHILVLLNINFRTPNAYNFTRIFFLHFQSKSDMLQNPTCVILGFNYDFIKTFNPYCIVIAFDLKLISIFCLD